MMLKYVALTQLQLHRQLSPLFKSFATGISVNVVRNGLIYWQMDIALKLRWMGKLQNPFEAREGVHLVSVVPTSSVCFAPEGYIVSESNMLGTLPMHNNHCLLSCCSSQQ